MTDTEFDILIVGAGLVGASIACAVAASGERGRALRIGVIEAGGKPRIFEGSCEDEGEVFDPRVVALSSASRHFLNSLGAWASIAQSRLCPYTEMHVWDSEGTASIHFDCREVRRPNLGYIVENSVVLCAIQQSMQAFPNIQLIPARVVGLQRQERSWTLELNKGQKIATRLLIAADGASSGVRSLAGFKTREWDYGHQAIITTVRTEKPHSFTARQCFLNTGPLAFLPLKTAGGDCRYNSIVWSAEPALAQELMTLTEAAFCARLERAFERSLGGVCASAERFCIPLRQRHAVSYVQPGIALVGDAAHTIHPLAGQGVNLGFLDAAALVKEIERALQRGIPLDDFSILRRYQRHRIGDNLAMMGAMEGFKRFFGGRDPALRWLRNTGMRQLDRLPALKNVLVKKALG